MREKLLRNRMLTPLVANEKAALSTGAELTVATGRSVTCGAASVTRRARLEAPRGFSPRSEGGTPRAQDQTQSARTEATALADSGPRPKRAASRICIVRQ